MKKYISLCALLFGSVFVFAAGPNNVTFVTTLSSPQGVFGRLEADALTGATSGSVPTLNYCTRNGTANTISLYGTSTGNSVAFDTLVLNTTANSKISTLRSDAIKEWYFRYPSSAPVFTLKASTVASKSTVLQMGRLLINNLKLSSSEPATLKTENTLYFGSVVETRVAKAENVYYKKDGSDKQWFPVGLSATLPDHSEGAQWAKVGANKSGVTQCRKADGTNVNATDCRILSLPK